MQFSQQGLDSLLALARSNAFATAAAMALGTPACKQLMDLSDQEFAKASQLNACAMGLGDSPTEVRLIKERTA